MLCYLPLLDPSKRARDLAEDLHSRLVADLPASAAQGMPALTLAIGKEAANVAAWPRSLREAEQALVLGRQLLDTRVLDFSDLGVYRLLVLLRESPELWEFYRATLASLADYDHRQGAELLKTLETFFTNLGNLARTAEALHVHRNTLLYRLDRIGEISGLDLGDAEDRLVDRRRGRACDWIVELDHRGVACVAGQQGYRRFVGQGDVSQWVGFYFRAAGVGDLDARVDRVECSGEFSAGVEGFTRDCARGARL